MKKDALGDASSKALRCVAVRKKRLDAGDDWRSPPALMVDVSR
jgi:hypothetical protein